MNYELLCHTITPRMRIPGKYFPLNQCDFLCKESFGYCVIGQNLDTFSKNRVILVF